ncbi:BA14K family protein [Nitratireductor luteus]|uniref:BA14K family protein n=1 Tax=Nitratireductor luteus TaxID=2976980 RepID=UPI00224094F7|nr:BA14K family protein [Nitratireductor luteus]
MKKHVATLCAAAMAFSLAAMQTAPSISAPLYPAPSATPSNGKMLQEVTHESWRHDRDYHRYKKHRHRRGNAGAFLGGLAAGAILGGLLSQSSRAAPVYRGDPHVQWCLQRYRSYDVRTDTFQPYSGPRRYCNSPYR